MIKPTKNKTKKHCFLIRFHCSVVSKQMRLKLSLTNLYIRRKEKSCKLNKLYHNDLIPHDWQIGTCTERKECGTLWGSKSFNKYVSLSFYAGKFYESIKFTGCKEKTK